MQQRKEIREAYQRCKTRIEASPRPTVHPYEIFPWQFSKAEDCFWHEVRCSWLPLYPEYPILNYFVDFANPNLKLAVEIDGKEWHQGNEAKDAERQRRIEAEGWKVERLAASSCMGEHSEYIKRETGREDWELDDWLEERGMTYDAFIRAHKYDDARFFMYCLEDEYAGAYHG